MLIIFISPAPFGPAAHRRCRVQRSRRRRIHRSYPARRRRGTSRGDSSPRSHRRRRRRGKTRLRRRCSSPPHRPLHLRRLGRRQQRRVPALHADHCPDPGGQLRRRVEPGHARDARDPNLGLLPPSEQHQPARRAELDRARPEAKLQSVPHSPRHVDIVATIPNAAETRTGTGTRDSEHERGPGPRPQRGAQHPGEGAVAVGHVRRAAGQRAEDVPEGGEGVAPRDAARQGAGPSSAERRV